VAGLLGVARGRHGNADPVVLAVAVEDAEAHDLLELLLLDGQLHFRRGGHALLHLARHLRRVEARRRLAERLAVDDRLVAFERYRLGGEGGHRDEQRKRNSADGLHAYL